MYQLFNWSIVRIVFFYHLKDSENTEKVRSLDEHRKLFTNVWIDFLQLKVCCHYSDRINTKIHNWNSKRSFDNFCCCFFMCLDQYILFSCVCVATKFCVQESVDDSPWEGDAPPDQSAISQWLPHGVLWCR